jgi:tRNA (guanine6-N2)-methyltransferase
MSVRNRQKKDKAITRSCADSYFCEVEVAEGMESLARDEIERRLDERLCQDFTEQPGAVRFYYAGSLPDLLQLQLATAVYVVLYYDIPRPRALLGHEHFHRLLEAIREIRHLSDKGLYNTFYISAAGSASSVMRRLKADLSEHTALVAGDTGGDLLLRIRRFGTGWEVLARIGPRPLATRSWRVCNLEGALNAPVAHAMILLTSPAPGDVVINLACGSATLMIERLLVGAARSVIGIDRDRTVLNCARQNIEAAGVERMARLICADLRRLPLSDRSADVILADLPFGQLVGSHEDNLELYPRTLAEAARIARTGARFALITHEVRLMERLLAGTIQWTMERVMKVSLRGLHPRIFLLRRT